MSNTGAMPTSSDPATKRRCRITTCFAPETPCNLGHNLSECEFFRHVASEATAARAEATNLPQDGADQFAVEAQRAEPPKDETRSLPWSGSSFGSADFTFVAARSVPRVLGLVGPHNAGKTTLLTVLYLLVQRGLAPRNRTFAGSFTLAGWESLAHQLRWSGGQQPNFPPHTPRGMRRVPGLLHLAFRRTAGQECGLHPDKIEDVLLTDPPGEWFGEWAIDRDAPPAEGARWITAHSDALALLVDSEALTGPDRGAAREQILRLSQRLSDSARRKRVAVVWTKSDIPIRESLRRALQSAFRNDLPGHESFAIQVPLEGAGQGQGVTKQAFLDLFTWLLNAPRPAEAIDAPFPSEVVAAVARDPFLMYRGHR